MLLVLFIGVDPKVAQIALDILKPDDAKYVDNDEEFFRLLDHPEDWKYDVVIAGPLVAELAVIEIGQSLRTIASSTPIYFCHHSRDAGFERNTFIKNGFSDAFLLPFEAAPLREALEDALPQLNDKALRPVRMIDISAGHALPFDLYIFLPLNQKYIQYSRAGHPIERERVAKLLNHHVGSVFVPQKQMQKFFEYTALKLKELNAGDGGLSETEKRIRAQSAIRNLLSDILSSSPSADFNEGKQLLAEAGEIVKAFMQMSGVGELYNKVLAILNESGDSYSHLMNVSTFAALFSIATGIGEPEELALAGLFHDLGLSVIPHETQVKDPDQWTDDERRAYQLHPEFSLRLIKEKKVALSSNIQTMILQHHERIDGKGYPKQIESHRFRKDAQLLAVADRFDELTQVKPGQMRVTPLEAIQRIQAEGAVDSDVIERLAPIFEPSVLNGKIQTHPDQQPADSSWHE